MKYGEEAATGGLFSIEMGIPYVERGAAKGIESSILFGVI
mgnify:CR=1 FL=1